MLSNARQSDKTLNVFVNQVGFQLAERVRICLDVRYAGSPLFRRYTLICLTGTGVASAKVQSRAPPNEAGVDTTATYLLMTVLSKPSTSPAKIFRGCSKKVRCQGFIHCSRIFICLC